VNSIELRDCVKDRVTAWHVGIERIVETESSVLVFGRRGDQPVVLKVVKQPGDEWSSGAVLASFEGRGVVRVLDFVEGALLLERLSPGDSLVGLTLNGRDEQATAILADVVGRMAPSGPVHGVPTVEGWGLGFERYWAGTANQIPEQLLADARERYFELCRTQTKTRLLHGDLHHANVLLDADRGWLAIDPKGVIGELEYELGAALRNPSEKPELFLQPSTIRTRVECFSDRLKVNARRILAWTFAQAVLSVAWDIEDGHNVDDNHPCLALADAIRPMLKHGI
jgi:streptomycin 6-kinase